MATKFLKEHLNVTLDARPQIEFGSGAAADRKPASLGSLGSGSVGSSSLDLLRIFPQVVAKRTDDPRRISSDRVFGATSLVTTEPAATTQAEAPESGRRVIENDPLPIPPDRSRSLERVDVSNYFVIVAITFCDRFQ